MKLFTRSVVLLLSFSLTACIHFGHKQQVQPPPPPVQTTPDPDVKSVEHPPTKATNSTPPDKTLANKPAPTQNTPNQHATHKPKPQLKRTQPSNSNGQAPNNSSNSATTLEASNQSPAVSVIGPLSSGESADTRKQTVDLIAAIERSLNSIDHKLGDQDQKTVSQIHEYLKQAKLALNTGDVDGAHILAAKAKLLLNELNR